MILSQVDGSSVEVCCATLGGLADPRGCDGLMDT